MFTTPAGMSVSSAMSRPSTVAHHGVSGAGFSTTVLPAARAGPSLARLIWWGTFHGVMAPTTPVASRRTQRCEGMPERLGHAEVGLPLVPLGQVGHPAERLDRCVELRGVGQRRSATPVSAMVMARTSSAWRSKAWRQLAQAPHPQLEVGGPVRGVEGPAGRADGVVQVLGPAVGGHAQHLAGRRVHRLEDPARPGGPQLAVDQEALLAHHRRPAAHRSPRAPPRPKTSSARASVMAASGQVDTQFVTQGECGPQILVGQVGSRCAWPR